MATQDIRDSATEDPRTQVVPSKTKEVAAHDYARTNSSFLFEEDGGFKIKVQELFGAQGGAGEVGRRIAAYDVDGGTYVGRVSHARTWIVCFDMASAR